MVFVKLVVLLTLTRLGVLCTDDKEEITEVTELRDGKEFRLETWRAVENDRLDMSGWIPQGAPSEHQQLPILKRRRLRKRKRRPAQTKFNDQNSGNMQDRLLYLPTRRQRPFKFGQHDEVWDDMQQESPKQAVNRRRVVPEYPSGNNVGLESEPEIVTQKQAESNPLSAVIRFGDAVEETTKSRSTERIRDPFDALKEAEEKQKTPEEIKQTAAPSNLKSLLKKTGGTISLSEILQQKNLSLSELLTGNIEAISALTTPPESTQPTEVMQANEPTRYQRIPPSERKKISDRVSEQPYDSAEIEEKQLIEAQRKRLALLQAHKANKIYLGITHAYEIVTEPITERRIFVPSHPKHYSTSSYKPILFQNGQKSTTVKTRTFTNDIDENKISESTNTISPYKFPQKRLPITSAKLLARTTKKAPVEKSKVYTIPPEAIRITIDEILKKEEKPLESGNDEPLQISLNFDIPTKDIEDSSQSSKESSDTEISNEKLDILGAGDEIMEMLEDPVYKDKLSRILRERNMTLQELVDQRERGSSQLHLADIFHNKTREPEPVEEPFVGLIIEEKRSNNSREQKSMKFDEISTIGNEILDMKDNKLNSEEEITTIQPPTEKKPPRINGFGKNISFNYAAIMPFWKQFHPDVFNRFYKEEAESLNDVDRIEDINNRLSDSITNKFNVELPQKNYHLDEESIFDIPSGIKSALVASFAIVGLSLFMFLTILLIFKWTQRKKNKLNYTSSLSGSKIKSPILEMPRRSALRTFVCETLGRRTKFYKSNLQSMSDIWDNKKEKF